MLVVETFFRGWVCESVPEIDSCQSVHARCKQSWQFQDTTTWCVAGPAKHSVCNFDHRVCHQNSHCRYDINFVKDSWMRQHKAFVFSLYSGGGGGASAVCFAVVARIWLYHTSTCRSLNQIPDLFDRRWLQRSHAGFCASDSRYRLRGWAWRWHCRWNCAKGKGQAGWWDFWF